MKQPYDPSRLATVGSDDIPQSLQDIADIVDVSLGTVKSNIKRAAEQIGEKFQFKSLLEEEEI